MNKYRLNIDGKEVYGLPGQTILEVCRENDIFIPTLCYDERTEIYGACGLCMVEMEGNPKLWKACATEIAPNMVIHTNTPRVIESRTFLFRVPSDVYVRIPVRRHAAAVWWTSRSRSQT